MLDKDGFDGWADKYDMTVDRSMDDGTYPFCGYADVHKAVFELVQNSSRVLDLGVGTARLTERLYEKGIEITGVDFSENMLAAARKKMPKATLVSADLSEPDALDGVTGKFDAIIALYSIHHLTDARKAELINGAKKLLVRGGAFVIGDVAFGNGAEREECIKAAGDDFDFDEYYCVADKLAPLIEGKTEFRKISFCSGVITVRFD